MLVSHLNLGDNLKLLCRYKHTVWKNSCSSLLPIQSASQENIKIYPFLSYYILLYYILLYPILLSNHVISPEVLIIRTSIAGFIIISPSKWPWMVGINIIAQFASNLACEDVRTDLILLNYPQLSFGDGRKNVRKYLIHQDASCSFSLATAHLLASWARSGILGQVASEIRGLQLLCPQHLWYAILYCIISYEIILYCIDLY